MVSPRTKSVRRGRTPMPPRSLDSLLHMDRSNPPWIARDHRGSRHCRAAPCPADWLPTRIMSCLTYGKVVASMEVLTTTYVREGTLHG